MTEMQSLNTSLASYSEELLKEGTVVLPANVFFTFEEISSLVSMLSRLPSIPVRDGDAGDIHDIRVSGVLADPVGGLPILLEEPSGEIIDLLDHPTRRKMLATLIPDCVDDQIRRCQLHTLGAGSFVGVHLDANSNPDFTYSVILQLGESYTGGDFLVHRESGPPTPYHSGFGEVLITTCHLKHEVLPVQAGSRVSLVYFYSSFAGPNRRTL